MVSIVNLAFVSISTIFNKNQPMLRGYGSVHEGSFHREQAPAREGYKNNNLDIYTVGFIGKKTNVESDTLFVQGNVVCSVYNDSMELEGNMMFML